MKMQQPNRAIILSALFAALLLTSPPNTNAQLATQQGQQSDSVVAIVADAMGLPFVQPEQRPIFGTYWEVRNTLPCMLAPLPCPPLDQTIPVYAIGDPVLGGQFLVDEMAGQPLAPQTQIYSRRYLNTTDAASIVQAQVAELQDFVAQVQERQANAQLLAAAGLSTMDLDGPGGGGVFGPLDYSYTADDLWLEIICVTNNTGVFTVHPPAVEQTNGVYDLLMTTNLTTAVPGLNLTNWYWVLRTQPGETNLVIPGMWDQQAFFRLARTNDADGDGLSDAIEHLVTHTDPNVPDPNPFPVIASQPLSQTVDWGDSVTFTVQTTGLLPLNYQW